MTWAGARRPLPAPAPTQDNGLFFFPVQLPRRTTAAGRDDDDGDGGGGSDGGRTTRVTRWRKVAVLVAVVVVVTTAVVRVQRWPQSNNKLSIVFNGFYSFYRMIIIIIY